MDWKLDARKSLRIHPREIEKNMKEYELHKRIDKSFIFLIGISEGKACEEDTDTDFIEHMS